MTVDSEMVALVALLRFGRRRHQDYVRLVEQAGSAQAVLERELGGDHAQVALFAPEEPPPWLETARVAVGQWLARDIQLVTVLDDGYPANLRQVDDRPPLLFIAGALHHADERSIAIIGARRASDEGLRLAAGFAGEFVGNDFTVVSGLAAGIDRAAHEAALAQGGRTVAVIGTGLLHRSYPPENSELQRRIAARCAVISQFWPDSPPRPKSFPMRNAVMSGLSRGSVVIEASERSGARVQARLALAHGRPVFLLERLLRQAWARELTRREGVHVVTCAQDVIAEVNPGVSGEQARE
ncbi:MAG TPA: DNA-processing protein DprA [Solirubrobacteraceae bacterium]|jgi:DNA processing protein|nr:DNA-processing protein DprA [Solirubrobacteraceae bacterium]